jgi:hypothetical protein
MNKSINGSVEVFDKNIQKRRSWKEVVKKQK